MADGQVVPAGRNAAIDGLRGISILAVVAFHAAPEHVVGGYVGVSVFFTISGYLIAGKLLDQHRRTDRIDLVAFWAGRVRRLLPAASITIIGTVLVAGVLGRLTASTAESALAASTYVANWWQLVGADGYGALFERAGPLDHFWSLAIEEQFYVVFPLLVVAVGARRRSVAVIGGGAAVAAFVVPALLGWGVERRYLGTDARLGEIAAGVVLAAIGVPALRSAVRSFLVACGLAVVVAATLLVPYGSDVWTLGFWPITVASLAIIAAVAPSTDRALGERVLAWPPLVRLGVWSYSWYLVHWPVLTLVRPEGVWPTTAAVVLSLALAVALHRTVERPFMGGLALDRRTLAGGLATAALVGVFALGVRPSGERDFLAEIDRAAAALERTDRTSDDGAPSPVGAATSPDTTVTTSTVTTSTVTTSTDAASTSTVTTVPMSIVTTSTEPPPGGDIVERPTDRPSIGFFGDSLALTLAVAVDRFADLEAAGLRPGSGELDIGCGLARFPDAYGTECDDPVARLDDVDLTGLDVAIVASCQWELVDRPRPDGEPVDITDPALAEYVAAEFGRYADALIERGVGEVWWVRCPRPSQVVVPVDLSEVLADSRAPARHDALVEVIDRVAAERADVEVLGLDSVLADRIDDPVLRPDGSHFEFEEDVGVDDLVVGAVVERLGA